MDLRELKIFRDIANENSFVKAAKLNFITQPAVSVHLKRLEEELGVKLLKRAPRKVSLTPEGELLLPHVDELLLKFKNLKSVITQSKNVPQGTVRVATIYSIGMYEFSPLLKKFIRAYPGISIQLQYRHSEMIYDLLLKDKIDIGIVAYPETRTKIHINSFGSDHLVLITPPYHPLAKRKRIHLQNIEGEQFIAFNKGVPTREAIDRALESHRVQISTRMTNENIDTLKRAVEVGLGISIVPSKTVKEEVRRGTLKMIEFSNVKLNRPLGILTLKNQELSYPLQLLMKILTE